MQVKNSEVLDIWLRIAADERVSRRGDALAGRGITVDALATMWALEVGKPSLPGLALADLLIEFGNLIDRLAELWRSSDDDSVPRLMFEDRLEDLVVAMESWLVARQDTWASSSRGGGRRRWFPGTC
ncbi:hypothetical protein [Amycolatopsis sp. NPDC051903]|uniref:hypothetical protein n=1 Tax=Amycolatopsis sp. NPDC051903 TaxID=3363936 RepID=UPI00379EEA52